MDIEPISAPAIITYKGQTIYTEEDFEVKFETDIKPTNTSMYGATSRRITNRKANLSVVPTQITAGILPVLLPWGAKLLGSYMFSSANDPLVIWSTDGTKITMANAAVFKSPKLHLSTTDSMLGAVDFVCIGKSGAPWSEDNSFIKRETATFVDPDTYDLATILNQIYIGSWADTGAWSAFTGESGIDVEFDAKLDERVCDKLGTYNFRFEELEVRASCVPMSDSATPITDANVITAMAFQGTGAVRGKDLNQVSTTHDLSLVGDEASGQSPARKLSIIVTKAAMVKGGLSYGTKKLRVGELGWVATRRKTAGAMDPLYTVTLA